MDHLRAVLGNATDLGFTSDHEAGDVLQEDEWDAALVTQLDEMRRLESGLTEKDSIVGDNADWVSVNARKATHKCCAVARFELAEFASIHEAGNDLVNIIGRAESCRED